MVNGNSNTTKRVLNIVTGDKLSKHYKTDVEHVHLLFFLLLLHKQIVAPPYKLTSVYKNKLTAAVLLLYRNYYSLELTFGSNIVSIGSIEVGCTFSSCQSSSFSILLVSFDWSITFFSWCHFYRGHNLSFTFNFLMHTFVWCEFNAYIIRWLNSSTRVQYFLNQVP